MLPIILLFCRTLCYSIILRLSCRRRTLARRRLLLFCLFCRRSLVRRRVPSSSGSQPFSSRRLFRRLSLVGILLDLGFIFFIELCELLPRTLFTILLHCICRRRFVSNVRPRPFMYCFLNFISWIFLFVARRISK